MLYLSTIDSTTLELLKTLMKFDNFIKLNLAGGTALALQLGHRKSIDIDLFGKINFEDVDVATEFADFDNVVTLKRSKNINIFSINNVKVDIVNYSYPWLNKFILMDGVRLASIEDIAAMKLAAITGRGSKKDFIDIFFLLQKFTLPEMIAFYNNKYFDGSEYLVLKSLTYFDDAENDNGLEMLVDISWDKVKQQILDQVRIYNKKLTE